MTAQAPPNLPLSTVVKLKVVVVALMAACSVGWALAKVIAPVCRYVRKNINAVIQVSYYPILR
jgi:hypothetical protein